MTKRAFLLAGLLLLGACTETPRVAFDSDPSVNFAAFRTYSWTYTAAPQGMNPLTYQRVRASIDSTLTSKGFTPADPGDFAVGFALGRRDSVEVTDFGAYGPGFRRWGAWGNNVDVRNVTDGTLSIDIFDTGTKQAVWHGVATQRITGDNVSQSTIDNAVQGVLANFPPPARR
jgi:hypothetical protein